MLLARESRLEVLRSTERNVVRYRPGVIDQPQRYAVDCYLFHLYLLKCLTLELSNVTCVREVSLYLGDKKRRKQTVSISPLLNNCPIELEALDKRAFKM